MTALEDTTVRSQPRTMSERLARLGRQGSDAHHPGDRWPHLAGADDRDPHHLVPTRRGHASDRLVDHPVRAALHPRQLRAGAVGGRHGRRVPQQPVHRDPVDDSAARHRLDGCIRPGVGEVPVPRHHVPHHRGDAHGAGTGRLHSPRHRVPRERDRAAHELRRRLAGPYRVSPCRSGSFCCGTSSSPCRRTSSRRPASTARRTWPSSGPSWFRCPCRPSRPTASSSSCGPGTIC